MAAITPNQIINLVGGKYGLNHVDNCYMDEFYLNGVPLEKVWNDETEGQYDGMVLDNLEKTILGEAEEYDEGTETDGNGDINQRSTKSASSLKQRISEIFNSGK